MKKKKVISMIMSAMLAVSSLASIAVSADNEKLYTLDELNNMSREEFLKLENAQSYYDSFKRIAEKQGGLKLVFAENTLDDSSYKYYYTEKNIIDLLGDNITFDMSSPIVHLGSEEIGAEYLMYMMRISNSDTYNYKIDELNDEEYLFYAKIQYCLKQVSNMHYEPVGQLYLPNPNASVKGDLNQDKNITVRDAAMLANLIACRKLDTMDESQSESADFNCDGKIDVRDCTAIAKYVLALNLASQDPALNQ